MSISPSLIAPSILASDFSKIGEEVRRMEEAGGDWIHCDVMDGHFVDNISFGSAMVEAVARHTSLPLDVHLMIERPDHYLDRYLPVASSVTVHVEAGHDTAHTLSRIRAHGCLAGLALSPSTPFSRAIPHAGEIDLLLIMTVVPGFGGQPFLSGMAEKIREAARWREENDARFLIEVDGGINASTARLCREAGAEVFVAGTSLFRAGNPAAEILALRGAEEKQRIS